MQESQEVRDDVVYRIRHEHLVAVKLDLVPCYLHPVLDLREIEDTCQMERIIHIKMNVEQWFVLHRIERTVELHVVLFLQVRRLLCPERLSSVDDIVLVSVDILAVLPLLLLAEDDRHRHELAVFLKEGLYAASGGELGVLVVYVKSDFCSPLLLVAPGHLIFRTSVACPSHCLRPLFP